MRIWISQLRPAIRRIPVDTPDSVKIEKLKRCITDRVDIPADAMLVILKRSGNVLADNQTLRDAGITDNDELYIRAHPSANSP